MFINLDNLATKYGVHDEIAQFFIDREPPKNNLYWHGKLLYVGNSPGFLFIPVAVDLLARLKISRKVLLQEEYITLLEEIGHIAALEETKQITQKEAIEKCIELTKDRAKNHFYYSSLLAYMRGEQDNFIAAAKMPYPALHRGDIFLFSVAILEFDDTVAQKIVENWFAVIGSFLLLDDAEDIEKDKLSGEENAFLECGLNKEGVEEITRFLGVLLTKLKSFNKPLARTIDNQFVVIAEKPAIKAYLNQ